MPPCPGTREPGCAGSETTEHNPSSAVEASTSPSVGIDSGSGTPSGPSAAAAPESPSAAPPAVTAPVLDAAPTSPCAAHDAVGTSTQAVDGTTVVEEDAVVVEEDEEDGEVDDSASTGALHTSPPVMDGSQQGRSADDDAVVEEGGEVEDGTGSSLYCSDVDSVDDHDPLAVDAAVAGVVLDVDVTGDSEHRAEGAHGRVDSETLAPVLELVQPVSAAPSPPPAAQFVGDAAQDAEGDANQGKSRMNFLYCTAGPRPAATCMLQRRVEWCSSSLIDALDR